MIGALALVLAAGLDGARAQMSGPGGGGGGGGSIPTTTQLQVQSLGVNTPAPAQAGDEELLDTTSSNTIHMCLGQFSGLVGLGEGVGTACPISGTSYFVAANTGTTLLNGVTGTNLRVGNADKVAVNATGAQISGSLGVGTANPATAGDIELLDATGGNTTHMCVGLQSSGNIGLGAGSCPVSTYALAASTANTYINGATQLTLQAGGQGQIAVTSGAVSLPAGAALQSTGGTAPTLTAGCNGAGSSVTAGSTNNRGKITTQTAASTSCTITWSASGVWNQAPFCVFMGTPGLTPGACTTSTCVVNFTSISAATPITYLCM